MDSLERAIAREIVLAQIASDSGKRIFQLNIAKCEKERATKYMLKEKHILNAITLISKNPQNRFRFWVEKGDISNSSLVYFTFLGRKVVQISFHTFGKKIRSNRTKGRPTFWDCKDSRKACLYLINVFKLTIENYE